MRFFIYATYEYDFKIDHYGQGFESRYFNDNEFQLWLSKKGLDSLEAIGFQHQIRNKILTVYVLFKKQIPTKEN